MRADALIVMAKAPEPGKAKTRLSPALGEENAARLARALLLDQLHHVAGLDRADPYLAFTPAYARSTMEKLAPPRFTLFAQRGGGLGARMSNCFMHLFSAGYRSIVLIGSDLAPVPCEFFARAYDFLDAAEQRVVLGPARDGGYYLVGCNRPAPELFTGMRWSHGAVLAETLAKIGILKIRYELLPAWLDVDTPADVRALRESLQSHTLARAMPETVKVLASITVI